MATSIQSKEANECQKLYGPYPKAIPVPTINKNGDTPSDDAVKNAKTMWDMKDSPDHRDVGTPDEWIPRDGRLVRLTGRHPFNVEPPLSVHHEHKFITPSSLHYVRNHGACPKLSWSEHRIKVGGPLVPKPTEFTMDQIVAMPPRELPVTLVCAGNRRKEQNMIRQTIGFNWGPSGLSTNVWKGVLLRDLLLKAGVSDKNMGGKHVEFIGVEPHCTSDPASCCHIRPPLRKGGSNEKGGSGTHQSPDCQTKGDREGQPYLPR